MICAYIPKFDVLQANSSIIVFRILSVRHQSIVILMRDITLITRGMQERIGWEIIAISDKLSTGTRFQCQLFIEKFSITNI
jgi:hypothetical protein